MARGDGISALVTVAQGATVTIQPPLGMQWYLDSFASSKIVDGPAVGVNAEGIPLDFMLQDPTDPVTPPWIAASGEPGQMSLGEIFLGSGMYLVVKDRLSTVGGQVLCYSGFQHS